MDDVSISLLTRLPNQNPGGIEHPAAQDAQADYFAVHTEEQYAHEHSQFHIGSPSFQ
jgi:hypothetical protein